MPERLTPDEREQIEHIAARITAEDWSAGERYVFERLPRLLFDLAAVEAERDEAVADVVALETRCEWHLAEFSHRTLAVEAERDEAVATANQHAAMVARLEEQVLVMQAERVALERVTRAADDALYDETGVSGVTKGPTTLFRWERTLYDALAALPESVRARVFGHA